MLSPELMPIHERLVNIRRQLVALAAKETASQATASARNAVEAQSIHPPEQAQTKPPEDDYHEPEMESKTPTKDMPNPEPVHAPKVKAELKPLQEELRKIDSYVSLVILWQILSCLIISWTENESMASSWGQEDHFRHLKLFVHLFSKIVSILCKRFGLWMSRRTSPLL